MIKMFYTLILLLFSSVTFAHGITAEAKEAMINGGYLKYVWLGAEHMITGYDHLLFLFGVIFFLRTFGHIVKFISVFTIGHSITLIFATFMGISANYWLIDAVIAISVIYKGFDNNKGFQEYFGLNKSPPLLFMVFLFGLIHGLGLSTRLQQLPLGEKGVAMLGRIISFNIGVELGQIAGLLVMLFVIRKLQKLHLFSRLSRVLNDGVMLAGFMLLLMQLHGYLHTSNPDEFAFSKDNHIHHHIKLQRQKISKSGHESL